LHAAKVTASLEESRLAHTSLHLLVPAVLRKAVGATATHCQRVRTHTTSEQADDTRRRSRTSRREAHPSEDTLPSSSTFPHDSNASTFLLISHIRSLTHFWRNISQNTYIRSLTSFAYQLTKHTHTHTHNTHSLTQSKSHSTHELELQTPTKLRVERLARRDAMRCALTALQKVTEDVNAWPRLVQFEHLRVVLFKNPRLALRGPLRPRLLLRRCGSLFVCHLQKTSSVFLLVVANSPLCRGCFFFFRGTFKYTCLLLNMAL
jgi:hypothetical protein